jgi:hypothetical protein
MRVVPLSGPATLRGLGTAAATAGVVLACALLGVGEAWASNAPDHLTVAPNQAPLGTSVEVSGACPASVAAPFVRATVRLEELDRSVELPVEDGAFAGSVDVSPGVGGAAPEPGTIVTARARCRTDVGVVAAAGDEQLVEVLPASAATPSATASAGTKPVSRAEKKRARRAAATSAAAPAVTPTPVTATPTSDREIDPTVPLIALGVAVLGSVATLTMSARRNRREQER